MALELKWQDISGMTRLGNAMGRLDSHQRHLVLQRAVNHTGGKAETQVIRTLAKQTGLPYGVIKKAVRRGKAWGASASKFTEGRGSLTYTISTKGGDISLKFFKARETSGGVTAAPFGKRKLFVGTFLRGGRFPERNSSFNVPTKSAASLNGHVWKRAGKKRNPIELQNSGVIIPEQMLQGASADAFTSTVNESLPGRVLHELNRLCPGIFL